MFQFEFFLLYWSDFYSQIIIGQLPLTIVYYVKWFYYGVYLTFIVKMSFQAILALWLHSFFAQIIWKLIICISWFTFYYISKETFELQRLRRSVSGRRHGSDCGGVSRGARVPRGLRTRATLGCAETAGKAGCWRVPVILT